MTKGRAVSLKLKLGIGASLLGLGTILAAVLLYVGMAEVEDRLGAALEAEARMARYATLSRQVSAFLVVASEVVQSGAPAETRADRVAPIADTLRETFDALQADVETAVRRAAANGIDEQSRYGTQSLGLARMEAVLESTLAALGRDDESPARLRGYTDTFAAGVDPLLSTAVSTEMMFRNRTLAGIEALRQRLARTAIVLAILPAGLVALLHVWLVRPQFRRIDTLIAAAQRIGAEDFAVALPTGPADELGLLAAETNRMAAALAARREAIETDRARLNEIIAERTEALRGANARLEAVDRDRRRFFADVSHELRTPLTVILMEAEIGQSGAADPGKAFATIAGRAARLNRRIDDLLRVARSDSGQLALEAADADLAQIAAEAIGDVRAEIENAGMTLDVAPLPPMPVHCDPNWVRQVLAGLMRNAIRHARSGGLVRVEAITDGASATVAVVDHGPGVPAELRDRVFDRFAQGQGERAQGFGLGLALARWVVEAQGGDIALESPRPGWRKGEGPPGTRVRVRLPVRESYSASHDITHPDRG